MCQFFHKRSSCSSKSKWCRSFHFRFVSLVFSFSMISKWVFSVGLGVASLVDEGIVVAGSHGNLAQHRVGQRLRHRPASAANLTAPPVQPTPRIPIQLILRIPQKLRTS